MKKGYKKLLIFQIILFLVLILNSFIENILNRWTIILFLIGIILIFKKVFGIEKDRKRWTKDIIFEILIISLVAFILYYLFGVIIGFYKNENYLTFYGIREIILPLIISIILKEYLRYQMLTKSEGSPLLVVTTCILFIFMDISSSLYYERFSSSYEIFMFIALTIFPSISNNIACTYISNKVGYKPNIVWLLIVKLYVYLLPIIPNPSEYILSIIRFIYPLVLTYRIYVLFLKNSDEMIERDYKKVNKLALIIPTLLVIVIVYLTSGYFRYYLIAIASGSMSPEIDKGDAVLIEKIYDKYDSLEIGQVIAYKYSDVIVVHRIVNIIKEDDKYYIYTKGDANDSDDHYVVYEDMVIGVVNYQIPYVGLPTVWLNEL